MVALWRVSAGQEDAFRAAWLDLAAVFVGSQNPALFGVLLQHESDRNLYEQAVIAGATKAKLPVTTIPATGTLFADASRALGVDLNPTLAALGKTVGSPWQKPHKEATAAALLALNAAG